MSGRWAISSARLGVCLQGGVPPPKSCACACVVRVEMIARWKMKGRQGRKRLFWCLMSFLLVLGLPWHDAGLGDAIMPALAVWWRFYWTSLLCLHLKKYSCFSPDFVGRTQKCLSTQRPRCGWGLPVFGSVLECGASKPQPMKWKGYGFKSLLPLTSLVWFCMQVFKEGPQNNISRECRKAPFPPQAPISNEKDCSPKLAAVWIVSEMLYEQHKDL